jgi:mRNA-degrading endonuclease RelE of RelBE toxin-antitoxin system
MTSETSVSKTKDGRFVVRFVNGVGSPLVYTCGTASAAHTLLEVLGLGRLDKQSHPQRHAYQVELSPTCRTELAELSKSDARRVRTAMARLAEEAADVPPPSRAMLVAAGVQPPVLREREGRHVILYEADGARLDVLHVLDVD